MALLRDPTAFLASTRAEVGDTFVLEAFGFELLFVFSPAGVAGLYRLPESHASFAAATRTLIGFKLPDALASADMGMFHRLFVRERVDAYLAHMRAAVRADLTELPAKGELEIFAHMKQLVHRMAVRCWAGREAASPRWFGRLVRAFDRLDPEEAFVHPARMFLTVLTRKAPEKRALAQVQAILAEIRRERTSAGRREHDLLESLHEAHADAPASERDARVARDVVILHLASQSNLYAALSWTLVNLLVRPELLARVRAAEDPTLLDRCAHESIRAAQRSITLRKVVQPCEIDDGAATYTVRPGVFVATMLSVNNGAFPGLESFDPAHYDGARVAAHVGLPTPEVVSTFGHHVHACPGRRFAIAAIHTAVTEWLAALELEPRFTSATAKPGQIGAVARAAAPCVVAFRKR
ncbi:MAG TPA: cytochrome P450 [Nannocystaceae bacterium]|nr:cytochrome P450 [Nannocystaceae bacterium]